MRPNELHAVTCSACGSAVPIERDDPRLVSARASTVTLDSGARAQEFVLFGACRACGGSVVRVSIDAAADDAP